MNRLEIINFSKKKKLKIKLPVKSEREITKYYQDNPNYVIHSVMRNAIPGLATVSIAKNSGPGRLQIGKEIAASNIGGYAGAAAGALVGGPVGAIAGNAIGGAAGTIAASAYEGHKRNKIKLRLTKQDIKEYHKMKKAQAKSDKAGMTPVAESTVKGALPGAAGIAAGMALKSKPIKYLSAGVLATGAAIKGGTKLASKKIADHDRKKKIQRFEKKHGRK